MKSKRLLIMIFPLLFALIPRPAIAGSQFLFYPTITFILGFLLLTIINRYGLYQKPLFFVMYLIALYTLMCISVMFSDSSNIVVIAINSLKYLMFIIIFLYAYYITRIFELDFIKESLLKAAYIIIGFQVIFSTIQLLDLRVFTYIYSMEKTQPLGGLVRVAGTMGNPNLFAWLVLQMAVIILLFEKRKFKKSLFIAICSILILFAGSRTALLLLPLLFAAVFAIRQRKNFSFFFFKIPFLSVVLFLTFKIGVKLLEKYSTQFPYLSQLLSIVETKNLSSVNSFDARTVMWNNARILYENSNNPLKLIFGIGPNTVEVLDNDYLLSYYNNGIMFTILNIALAFLLLLSAMLLKERVVRTLMMQYILFTFLVSFQADTLTGWLYPQFMLFYGGMVIALLNKQALQSGDGPLLPISKIR